jgi:hypothetical protein
VRGTPKLWMSLLSVAVAALTLAAGSTAGAASSTTLQLGTPQVLTAMTSLGGIACPTATTCEAVGYNDKGYGTAYIVTITNGVPGTPQPVTGTDALGPIACDSSTTCYAIGVSTTSMFDGILIPIVNGTPGTGTIIPNFPDWSAMTCPSSATCEAVGPNGVMTIAGGVPGTPVKIPGDYSLSGVSCETATACIAVGTTFETPSGQQAIILPITSGVPGTETQPSLGTTSSLGSIDCVSSAVCFADGTEPDGTSAEGFGLTLTSGTAGTAQVTTGVAGLGSLACPSASLCVALGFISSTGGAVVPVTDGVPGPVTAVPTTNNFGQVACPSATSCLAMGQGPQGGVIDPITVIPPLAVSTTSLPSAQANSAYSATLSASGGQTPYTWTLSSGSLPPGLTLSPAGVISGTPTTTGTYAFGVGVSDSSSPPQSTTGTESITVSQTAVATNLFQELLDFLLALLRLLHL